MDEIKMQLTIQQIKLQYFAINLNFNNFKQFTVD